jgi:prepilin-type N-terminal cleavage/methylation domain-containing protein
LRSAFTLIELLITITIIAIVSAAILGTASSALEAGRRSRTQSLITKINGLLLERWDSYAERRYDVNPWLTTNLSNPNSLDSMYRGGTITAAERGEMLSDLRLLALRELMKYEMPDRWSDVIGNDLGNVQTAPIFLASIPGLAQAYFRHTANATVENEGAECLYLTVMYATGDGEARTQFSTLDVGDVDEDGAPEFLDGWGRPLEWLRWAPGFVSRSATMTGDADADHDPYDPYRRDLSTALPILNRYPSSLKSYIEGLKDNYPAFRLVPLVFSAGPDGIYDIISSRGQDDGKVVTFTGANNVALNPYFIDSSLGGMMANTPNYGFGLPDLRDEEDQTKDNLTNHLNEY